jgi:hypothetical protein
MPDTETKQITGQCVEISEKNGWTTFHVDVGSQYPVKLSTKKPSIAEGGRAAGSDVAVWTFQESDGNENPNRPGTFYKNRWLDKVETGGTADSAPENTAGGTAPAQQTTSQVPTPHHDAIAPADKDRAIVRQACLKASAWLLQGVPYENDLARVAAWMAAASAAERHVYKGIDDADYDDPDLPF